MIEESIGGGASWSAAELGAVLRDQLDAQWDMEWIAAANSGPKRHVSHGSVESFRSMANLFSAPHPPVLLLKQAKEFAKANYAHPESFVPPEVSLVLYFAAIAAAEVRCRKRISRLDAKALRSGFEWALGRSWLDNRLKELISRAKASLDQPGADG